VGGIFWYFKFS